MAEGAGPRRGGAVGERRALAVGQGGGGGRVVDYQHPRVGVAAHADAGPEVEPLDQGQVPAVGHQQLRAPRPLGVARPQAGAVVGRPGTPGVGHRHRGSSHRPRSDG